MSPLTPSKPTATIIYDFAKSSSLSFEKIANILEEIYSHAEYSEVLVDVVKCFRNELNRKDFTDFFHSPHSSHPPHLNLEWYLEHISITLEKYVRTRDTTPVYEWM